MRLSRNFPVSTLVPLILLVLATLIRLYEPTFVTESRLQVFDTYQRIKPRQPIDLPITIIDIDDESLTQHGQWPWPRNILADLVNTLSKQGAAVITFDVLFSEPDRLSTPYLADLLKDQPGFDDLKTVLDQIVDNDQLFAKSIELNNVVIGFALGAHRGTPPTVQKWRYASIGLAPQPYLLSFSGAISAIPTLQAAATGQGYLTHTIDSGEVVRLLPLFARINDTVYPSLAAESLRVAQRASTFVTTVEKFGTSSGLVSLKIGQLTVPTDSAGRIWIRYRDPKTMQRLPAWKVLSDEISPEMIAGRIVLVGSTALGVANFAVDPLGELTSSVEIQAQALETILSSDYLQRPDFLISAEVFFCLALGLLLIWLLPRWGMLWCAILALSAIAGIAATAWVAFDQYKFLVDLIYPTLIIILVYLSGSFSIYLTTRARLIRTTWLVEHDVLTGSLSRRAWYDRTIAMLDRCQDRQGFLVAMLDIDFFKKINDTYGHINGDEALKHTVNVLSSVFGDTGIFGRLGGEEFGLSIEFTTNKARTQSPQQAAADILEQARQQLEQSPLHIQELEITLTVSIGATFLKTDERLNDAVGRADNALYSSKESGRNQVIFR